MPEQTIHLTALREAARSQQLEPAAGRRIAAHEQAARLGALLVDLPYFHKFAGELVRHVLGFPPRASDWGQRLHEGGAIRLLHALLGAARAGADPALGAVALGLASHVAIDRALHPLINALARRHPFGYDHESAHRQAEKFHAICFHQTYFGRDVLGTDSLREHFGLRIDGGRLTSPILRGFTRALGSAPSARDFRGFYRGYQLHVRLLASVLGRHFASPATREAASARYMHGAWGAFDSSFRDAIRASVSVINAACSVLEASEREQAAAFEALGRVLPPGSIDPEGGDVDLERPYLVTLLGRAELANDAVGARRERAPDRLSVG